ncbi:X-ray radiation resistance-associated protein 1 isoform X3 [Ictalurus furcatus]|uniref:X-ray radiation resistance-associated protein 1 isoform X3 n=1 Tax=Ictalurus furcatus TaxID=66913 RepID=UPI002350B6B4|nr:X-ray radiation resistance-associated protein 1 isoform X3 [Ictalurus furcatus]
MFVARRLVYNNLPHCCFFPRKYQVFRLKMAGSGVYKLDNGESFPTNCFPIRSFHQSKEGAGHWLIAHRGSVEDRYKFLKQPTSVQHFCTGLSGQSECERRKQRTLKRSGNTLNGQILMALHCVDRPTDLCSVDISERKLDSVTLEGLEEFDCVAYINASDNYLTLEAFSRFPALRELELSLNGLSTVEVNAVDFPRLEVLDLSYNNLSSDGILSIGLLPRLKVLHLTGNDLQMLLPDMAGPNTPHGDLLYINRAPESSALFQTLEVLMLGDNKLSSCVFGSLANLKRLQHLNLEGNYISEVPYLQLMPLLQGPGCSDSQEDEEDFCPPFPELRYLNLANNKIFEEDALLAVALLPLLSELVIHSNPLTTQRSGDLPMLNWILQDRLGIKMRHKKSADIVKPHLLLSVNPKRKVETKLPKVPKVSLLTAALCASEIPSTDRGTKQNNRLQPSDFKSTDIFLPSASQTNTEEMEKENVATGSSVSEPLEKENSELHSESQLKEEFFVTEIIDLLEPEYQDRTEQTADITHLGRNDAKQYPEKLLGYEALLDDVMDLDMPKPAGIQQTVRVLEYTLKNLLVYRDSKANLNRLQRPYKEQPKRTRNLLPAKPQKTKGEKVKEILTEMKEMKTISEVPLEKVLRGKDIYRNEYEKALILLKDLKSKYKMIHLKSLEQAAQIESNYH